MNASLFILAATLFLASGCSYPMTQKDLGSFVRALAEDSATACVQTGVGWGAGIMTFTPVPTIPAGGGGGYLTICRTNEPGSEIEVNSNGMKIKHGFGSRKRSGKHGEAELYQEEIR